VRRDGEHTRGARRSPTEPGGERQRGLTRPRESLKVEGGGGGEGGGGSSLSGRGVVDGLSGATLSPRRPAVRDCESREGLFVDSRYGSGLKAGLSLDVD